MEEAGVQRGSRCARGGRDAGRRQGCPEEAGVTTGGRGVRLLSHWAAVFPAREVLPARCRLSGRPFRAWDEVRVQGEVEEAPAVGAEESGRKSCWCEGLFGRRPLAPQRGDSWNKRKSWNCSSLGSEQGPGPGRVGDTSCGQRCRREGSREGLVLQERTANGVKELPRPQSPRRGSRAAGWRGVTRATCYQGDELPGRCLVGDAAWPSHAGWAPPGEVRRQGSHRPRPLQPPGCSPAALLPGSSRVAETDMWSTGHNPDGWYSLSYLGLDLSF